MAEERYRPAPTSSNSAATLTRSVPRSLKTQSLRSSVSWRTRGRNTARPLFPTRKTVTSSFVMPCDLLRS